MDGLTFTSNLINSLVWPMVVVAGIVVLRSPISKLLPQMQKLKFKDLEADFLALSVSDQSLLFLDGVARKDQWTFYKAARAGERELGQAFSLLVADLLKVEKGQIFAKLKSWLTSGEANLIWFASEVIGYFQIKELGVVLRPLLPRDINQPWKTHELNCLWGYARCTGMESLNEMLLKTNSEHNQQWLLFVYQQMPIEHQYTIAESSRVINSFLERRELSEAVREVAQKALLNLDGV